MRQIDIKQYQDAPTVRVQFVKEIPGEYVLQKDGKVYLVADAFSVLPGLAAHDQLDGRPVALVRAINGGTVAVYLKLQQPGEEKAFFVGSDGNTYLPLRDTCTEFGIHLTQQNNIITLKR